MSIESLAIALHHSRATGTAKLVLIGIANHNGDGGSWPAVATLAIYAGVTRRNVVSALDRLEKLGEIRRVYRGGGTHRTPEYTRPNLYEFLLRCPADCDRTSSHSTARRRHIGADLQQLAPELHGAPTGGVASDTPPVSNSVSKPVDNRMGGVASDTGGVSLATPELSLELNLDSSALKQATEGSVSETIRPVCAHDPISRDRPTECIYSCAIWYASTRRQA